MKKLPTDRRILKIIYKKYAKTFEQYSVDNKSRSAKMYVPIDIESIAKRFKTDPDMIFGRLYYHLDKKYGYKQENGSEVHLFTLMAGADKHCVPFPYLAAVLVSMESENKKFLITIVLSVAAITISLMTSLYSLFMK